MRLGDGVGAYDWDRLVTRQANHYEPGLFDARGPQPRYSALGSARGTLLPPLEDALDRYPQECEISKI